MNLLLLEPENMSDSNIARIYGRQLQHLHKTLKAKVGDSLCVGMLNGMLGQGKILELDDTQATLEINLSEPPPSALPVRLVIALPRPKMLKRIIQTASTMGVKEIYFINSWKVEKSYWQSPWLTQEKIKENLVLGLEQARDTLLPQIYQKALFKPFVEDELPGIIAGKTALLAHPGSEEPCPVGLIDKECTLVIGPEGGFTPYEVEKLVEAGCKSVHLGERILRVETAVPVLLSRLYCN